MPKKLTAFRRAPLMLATLATVTAAAACGSSSTNSSTSTAASSTGSARASGQGGNRSSLIACLRRHGVTLPSRGAGPGGGAPPAGATGGGAPAGGSAGAPPTGFPGGAGGNPKLQAAFKACGGTAPTGRRSNGTFRAAVVKYVACVRQHGYQLPNPNFTGHGAVFSAKIQSDPKFKSASKACQSLLAGSPTGAPPGA